MAAETLRRHRDLVLPHLVKMIDAEDSAFTLSLVRVLNGVGLPDILRHNASYMQTLGQNGLWSLGPLAEPAIPQIQERFLKFDMTEGWLLANIGPPAFPVLESMLTNDLGVMRGMGLFALRHSTNHVEKAVPMLTAFIRREPQTLLRIHAALILGRIGDKEASIVPLLVDGLTLGREDSADCARALANFPAQARKHLPELEALAADRTDPVGRQGAIDALKNIAPELVPKN